MQRALPVHLVQIAALVGVTAFASWTLWPAVPSLNRTVGIGLVGTFVAAWLAFVALAASAGHAAELARQRWRRCNRFVAWAGSIVTVAAFWLGAPYADPALRLVVLVYMVGTVTFQVMGSIRRPPERGRPGLEPLIIPVCIALYYAVHWERYSPALIVFALAYGFVALSLARTLQRAVDRTYAAREAAEAARDAKARFLASASHDLGQPLQAARLFFDQVLRSPDPAARERAAGKVAWAFDATEELLNRILEHLRLEAGAVEPHLDTVAVGPLIARVVELNEPAARLAGVEVVALPSRLQAVADEGLTQRALGNLVGNSLRHAKARRVLVGARRRAGRIRVWVIDDGVGVSEADAPRLFTDYHQGSDHGDEIRGGFGLGLASSRRIAELMGAAVGLERKWTKGAAFWLELPAAPEKAG